ncbi:MAG: peptidase MA family metallohydrolase [Nitrospirota bacterium]|nr:peptidase MA family metallohydrolase [Nitrospirota bacterium]
MREGIIVVLVLAGLWLVMPPRSKDTGDVAVAPAPEPAGDASSPQGVLAPQEEWMVIAGVTGQEAVATGAAADAAAASEAYSRGITALESERFSEAASSLEAARNAGDRRALVPLAVALWKAERLRDAVNAIRNAAVEQPENPDVWLVMGEVMEAVGDLQAAVDAWEHLRTLRPDSRLDERIRRARADLKVRDRWRSQVSRNFSVFFEGPVASQVAHTTLDALEDARRDVGGVLHYYPGRPIEAVLYTRESFFDVTRSPAWSGGVFDGRVRLPVSGATDPGELRRVATHEYVHAALHSMAGDTIPTWLHEGMAMNLEADEPSYAWARSLLMDSETVPLSLEKLGWPFLALDEEQANVAYAQSFVLVNSLLTRFGHYKLRDLVNGLATGDQPLADVYPRIYRETLERSMERAMADLRTREESGWRRS